MVYLGGLALMLPDETYATLKSVTNVAKIPNVASAPGVTIVLNTVEEPLPRVLVVAAP